MQLDRGDEALMQIVAKTGRGEHLDMRTEREELDDGRLERTDAERGLDPTVVVGFDLPTNPKRLDKSEDGGEAAALGRDSDRASLATPHTPRMGHRRRWLKLRAETVEQLESAAPSTGGVDRDPGARQLFDVAQHRAAGTDARRRKG